METIYPLGQHGYERLTELTLDGLLTPITASTWVRRGTVLSADDRARALRDEVGDHLVLSHTSAWWVHTGITRASYPIHLTTHPRRRCPDGPGQVVHERSLPDTDVTKIAGLPLTTLERTLYDILLDEVRSPGPHTVEVITTIIDETGQLCRGRFREYLARSPRRPYVARIREAFENACSRSRTQPQGRSRHLGAEAIESTLLDIIRAGGACPTTDAQPPEMR